MIAGSFSLVFELFEIVFFFYFLRINYLPVKVVVLLK